ncbi:MAG: JAB domain-containing protein [Candidatus Thorarchaeota archaeon]
MKSIRDKATHSYYEALAALTNDEIAKSIMAEYPSPSKLSHATTAELATIRGIGTAKAKQIVGAIALSGHVFSSRKNVTIIHSPKDVFDLVCNEMCGLVQEEMRVILLNTRNHVLGIRTIYRGSLNSAQIRVGEVFRHAIREGAAAIILVHNHPSGNPAPSPDDIAITKEIIEAGKLLDIHVLDHVIIGKDTFRSLSPNNLAFKEEI